MFNNSFPKIVPFIRRNGKKYGTTGQATDDKTALAHCVLGTQG